MKRVRVRRIRLWATVGPLVAAALTTPAIARAGGPPFFTDDPEPVEFRHWEVYIASQHLHGDFGNIDTRPHFEVNYGPAPNLQLHAIVPLAYVKPDGGISHYGLGDMELGLKYRFVQETRTRPQIGTFPLVEVPTGDSNESLGNGVAQFFVPIWAQKSWGPWMTYGGGGYWRNPGGDNRDYWYAGWLLQKTVSSHLTLGAEVFHTTSQAVGESGRTGLNAGLIYDFDEGHHLLFSAGEGLGGPARSFFYAAYQWTFGPHGHEHGS